MWDKFKLTKEDKERIKRDRIEHVKGLTMAYQLGMYIGKYIIHRYLPTLSVDGLHSNTNISVTCAEGDECRRLNEAWFTVAHKMENTKDTEEWKALRAYHKMLEDKYLPKELECYISPLNLDDKDVVEFKKGISHSLWDCDMSHYSTEEKDIEIVYTEDMYFTIIKLKKA